MEEEEYIEPPPPSADRVARRALVLSVVCCRGFVDRQTDAEPTDLAKNSHDWLIALGLDEELSNWEKQLLATPFGGLRDRDRINATWLSEGLVVLAWALGKAEMPGFDVQCDPGETASRLGFLQPAEDTVLAHAILRNHDELSDYNEFIYNLHWRIRDFSLNKNNYDFESLARKAWGEPVLRYGLNIVDTDIGIAGKPSKQGERRGLE